MCMILISGVYTKEIWTLRKSKTSFLFSPHSFPLFLFFSSIIFCNCVTSDVCVKKGCTQTLKKVEKFNKKVIIGGNAKFSVDFVR